MKSITIKGSKRESVGKKATKALRNAEKVPCVLYGGKNPLHFSALEKDFKNLVYTSDQHTVTLELESGFKTNAVLQDIQFHPVTEHILHMDFYEFEDDQEIELNIPVHVEGDSIGVKNGGHLRSNLRRMRLKGLAANLPDYVVADITDLKIGDKLYVEEVASDDYEILHDDDAVICQVRAPRSLEDLVPDTEEEEVEVEGEETEEGAEGAEASEEGAEEDKKEGGEE